ncbi:hypothetical protein [Ramlibacter sp.]|uniref:hypothetical protein n=1 Tax=Ramlibacter sp. TaxID=1917967 RepID=UPI002FCB5BDD
MNRKLILAAALGAGSFLGAAQAAPAVVDGTYYADPPWVGYQQGTVEVAPPPPVYEVVPRPRPGFVWSPGHYQWRGDRYVWLSGQWLQARPGYAWQAPHWQRRGDGSWILVNGDWVRSDNYSYGRPYGDRDRDGVPNRYDRADQNPYRY